MIKRKLLPIVITILLIIPCLLVPCYAEEETVVEPLTVKTIETLTDQFNDAQRSLYDVNSYQFHQKQVYFNCDSNGVPYADGKIYCYMQMTRPVYTGTLPGLYKEEPLDLSDAYEKAREDFKTCLTPELAEIMLENLHYPGGPDIELVRQDENGLWYRLYSMFHPAVFERDISEIRTDGTKGYVYGRLWIVYFDDVSSPTDGWMVDYIDGVVEFEYTENGWLISGGTVIDLMRNYAETAVCTGDDSAVRVVLLATAAVMCAIIPATVAAATKRRRREA